MIEQNRSIRSAAVWWLVLFVALYSSNGNTQVVTLFQDGFLSPAENLAAGSPDGNVWFTTWDGVGRITPAGVVTEFFAGITPRADPHSIVTGPDGNLWFTEPGLRRIGRITPSGVVTEFDVAVSAKQVLWGITAGPDGNLWFADMGDEPRIGRITPSGALTYFNAPGMSPREIAAGPDGNLWFTNQYTLGLGRITPSGVLEQLASTSELATNYIVAGPDGNMWFTCGHGIGRITPGGELTLFPIDTPPYNYFAWGIVAAPDGNLWFTEFAFTEPTARIGRITTSGKITHFSAGIAADAQLFEIVVGPDGNLWVVDGPWLMKVVIRASAEAPYAVEYYHSGFDHYFITWAPDEIAKLDAGTQIRGWTRTGYTFKTLRAPVGASSNVCRYYIPPAYGDSHFFGRDTTECAATAMNHPSFVLEDPAFMHMFLPVEGICPAHTTPVYRVFSNRVDANHRYTTVRLVRDAMIVRGWMPEGDGPGIVAMCAPD